MTVITAGVQATRMNKLTCKLLKKTKAVIDKEMRCIVLSAWLDPYDENAQSTDGCQSAVL